jgi:hypothetical protein
MPVYDTYRDNEEKEKRGTGMGLLAVVFAATIGILVYSKAIRWTVGAAGAFILGYAVFAQNYPRILI